MWNTGNYGTWIEQVGVRYSFDSQCLKFYLKNKYLTTNAIHQQRVAALYKCPCNLDGLGAQWYGYSWTRDENSDQNFIYCFILAYYAKDFLARLRGNPYNMICCYNYTAPREDIYWHGEFWLQSWNNAPYIPFRNPSAGHLLLNDPWIKNGRNVKLEDFNPHRWCCINSSSPSYYCNLFNEVRPSFSCTMEPEILTGAAVGDPHIQTLDGHKYTFNGLGEYVMLSLSTQDFVIQARTKQVLNSRGNKTSATVFVAFAAKEGNDSSFQVELDSEETGLVIMANNEDATLDFYALKYYNKTFRNISLQRDEKYNRTTLIASFSSGITLKVYVAMKNLEFSVDVPILYKGKLSGLMGNFNDNPEDDFMLPNGTVLMEDKINTDRKIFENFGKEWEVTTSNTVFTYPLGESAIDYQHPEFTPLFKEDMDPLKLAQAQILCGNNDACIFDFILSESQQFALNSKVASRQAEALRISQTNRLPVLTLNSNQLNSKNQWEVTHGRESVLIFNATDADEEDNITYYLTGTIHSSISLDPIKGVLTYTPNASMPVTIGVQAIDSKGGSSPLLYVDLAVCSTCSKSGTCDLIRTRPNEKENGRFVLFVCQCLAAYTGEDCESELDACRPNPCLPNQTCVDLPASGQGNSSIGYTCGSCPTGFEQMNTICVDVNECFSNETKSVCPEHSSCENIIGSFKCACQSGFRIDPYNSSRCKDIDECIEGATTCQQICVNNEGNYSCACLPGNRLEADEKSCQLDPISVEACSLKRCSQACKWSNGTASCSCYSGYTLSNDTHCTDVDECSLSNPPCSQSCLNTNGSFQCSCYPGYKLNNEGSSCTVCPKPYYGGDCSKICVCNGHGTCHHLRGCECYAGWAGESCNQDVDECITDGTCLMGQICVNTYGSYDCTCQQGYKNESGQCKDVNECLDVLDNTCDLTTENCVNNQGSYSCECIIGYARNKYNVCTDIDECSTKTHNCEQICENTAGKYNCKCIYGYKLNIDRSSCVKNTIDVCDGVNLTCSQICTVDLITKNPYCLCKSGYYLQGTETCVDINECQYEKLNLCSQKDSCINADGGYNCSCAAGFTLDNNKCTCIACSQGKWGVECANDCACSTGTDRCDPQKGCICKVGFTGVHCDKDLDECSTGLLICGIGEKCVNAFGNASCQCIDGYSQVDGKCQDLNECNNVQTHDCSQVCTNNPGSFACSCYSGFSFEPVNKTCTDIDECLLNLHVCTQRCENLIGSYRCSCLDGWKLDIDRVSCVESTKCLSKACSDLCSTVDDVDTCFCPKGKQLNPKNRTQCIDVDMCKGNPCSDKCMETEDGSRFECSCPIGKQLAADFITCLDCRENKYGVNCFNTCNCNTMNTVSCDKMNGSCICKTGWSSPTCDVDIDECKNKTLCPLNSKCKNTNGSYVCKCHLGYFSSNSQCQVCMLGTYGEECKNQCLCDLTHSTCNTSFGQCVCHEGWTGSQCDRDVDECKSISNACQDGNQKHWVCVNTLGSYKCSCETGYVINNSTCEDINECMLGIHDCQQVCNNNIGSYTCQCNDGYMLNDTDRKTCIDIDECSVKTDGCEQQCTNVDGSFFCYCKSGYQLNETNAKTCFKSIEYTFQLRIEYDVNGKNLREKQGKDYLGLKSLTEAVLKETFRSKVKSLVKINILNLRPGSLIVDFETVLEVTNETYVVGKIVETFIDIAKSGLQLAGTMYQAIVTVANVTVLPSTDKCWVLEMIETCHLGEKCQISSEGLAYCKKITEIEKEANTALILGLTMGLTLGLALVIAMACCIRYKRNFNRLNRNDANSSERSFSNQRPNYLSYQDLFAKSPTPTRWTKGYDKQKLYP